MAKLYDSDIKQPGSNYWADNRHLNVEVPEPKADAGYIESLDAGLRTQSLPIQYLYTDSLPENKPDPTFDTYKYVTDKGYEQDLSVFNPDDNQQVVDAKIKNLEEFKGYEEILARSGKFGYVSNVVGGLANASTFVPIVGGLSKLGTGLRVSTAAIASGAALGGATAAEEYFKRQVNLNRTEEESNFAIAAATIAGGAFGGAASLLSKPTSEIAESAVIQGLKGEPIDIPSGISTAGAAQVDFKQLADELTPDHLPDYVTGPISKVTRSPYLRMVSTPYVTTKEAANNLYLHNMILKGNKYSSMTNPKSIEGSLDIAMQNVDSLMLKASEDFYKLKGVGGILKAERTTVNDVMGKGYTVADFSAEVGKSMRRGAESVKPEIASVAAKFNTAIDDITKKLVDAFPDMKVKLETADATHIKNYLTRYPDKTKMRGDYKGFTNAVATWMKSTAPDMADDEAELAASNVFDSMLGLNADETAMTNLLKDFSNGEVPKFMKDRNLLVPDEVIEPWLVNDGMAITKKYLTEANKLLKAKEYFEAQGVSNLKEGLVKLRNEHQLRAAVEGLTEKDLAAAEQIYRESYEALFGISTKQTAFDPALRIGRNIVVGTSMNGLIFTSAPVDSMMAAVRHGWKANFQDGIVEVVKHLKAFKMTPDQYSDHIQGLTTAIGESVMRMTGQEGGEAALTQVGKIEAMSRLMPKITMKSGLFSQWNAAARTYATVVSGNQILRKIERQSADDIVSLNALGISEASRGIIAKQFAKHGGKGEGAMSPNLANWDLDKPAVAAAQEEYLSAILRDINSTIITPGAGDIPIAVQNNQVGKAIALFSNYFMASGNKIGLSLANRADAKAAEGLATMMAAGVLTYIVTSAYRGKEIDTSPENMAVQALSAGAGGMLVQVPLRLGNVGSRFGTQTASDLMMGPVFSTLGRTTATTVKTLKGEELGAQDYENYIKLIWMANYPFLRDMLGIGREDVKEMVKKSKKKE